MKFLVLVLFMLFLVSCSQERIKPVIDSTPVKNVPKSFMSDVEVKVAFTVNFGQKVGKTEVLSQEGQQRMQNLIPNSKFFTPSQMSKKRKVKSEYASRGSADLRATDSPVENQWNGTCTAHALRNVIDNKNKGSVSTRHIWSAYKVYSCEAAVNAWLEKGCITSSALWPHGAATPLKSYLDASNCYTHLSKVTYINDDLEKMKESLDKGNPVYLGMSVTSSMLNCDKILAPTSKVSNGGHALAIVGYKDDANIKGGGYFIVKNSWGTDCGDKGYQYVPYYHCQRKDMYCIMWTVDEVKTTYSPVEPVCLEWKPLWYAPWKKYCVKWENK